MERKAERKQKGKKAVVRNAKKPQPKPAKSQLALRNGTHGVNVRSEESAPKQRVDVTEQSPGTLNTITVVCTVKKRAIAYLAMGIVLAGIKKGSITTQGSGQESPYYQFRYLIDVFSSCMNSGVMLLTAAPHWVWELLYALKPKQGPFKTGFVNYTWRITDDGAGVDQQFQLGIAEDNYSIYWGTGLPIATSSVNNFPVWGPSAPYTQDLGLTAISKLWPFIMQSGETLTSDPGPEGVKTSRDTSSFAVVYPELGESYFSEGGVRTTIYSERHIDSPLFCQFAEYQPGMGSPFWRGWHDARVGAGTPSLIGPMMISMSLRNYRNKCTPIIKFYNFDEFYEQLSMTMCMALENREQMQQTVLPCPLNAYQVSLLLRQTILQVCCNEYAQDVRYSGASCVDLLPFTVGPNGTLGGQNVGMLLPTFLAENIRAISTISTKTSTKFKDEIRWIPVLARPPSLDLPVKWVFGQNSTALYADPGAWVPISLIDLSAQDGQNTIYVDITKTEMAALLASWNKWITEISSTLSPLVTVTSEGGIRAINCNTYTNIIENLGQPVPQGANKALQKTKSKSNLKTIGVPGVASYVALGVDVEGDSYMEWVGDRRITSLSGFSKALDQIIDNFILPVNYSNEVIADASIQGYQAFMIEPSQKSRAMVGGYGGIGLHAANLPSLYERHLRAATIDTKAFGTADQQNEIIAAFEQLAKMGRGGFLTSALSGLANMLLPGSGEIVTQIGGLIGV